MLRRNTVLWLLLAGLLGGAGMILAGPVRGQDERVRTPVLAGHGHGGGSLDEVRAQLLYVKTTDYGATWSALTAATSLGALTPDGIVAGDFSAVATAGNELCYVVPLTEAPVPGVYSFTGPTFAPVLVMAEDTNDFHSGNGGGWSDIGRTPNGDLLVVIWSVDIFLSSTFWGVKSINNGASWGAPWVIAAELQLPWGATYPHIADLNSATHGFVLFQNDIYEQYVLRFSVAGGAGTITSLNAASGMELSYYTGNCKPIAYDPGNNALYTVFRNSTLSGVAVFASMDQGLTWTDQGGVFGPQRYPSVALNAATQTPYVFSNFGVPPDSGMLHQAWYASDEGGYEAGLWTDPVPYASIPYQGNVQGLLYMNEGYWWDANHGVSTHNYWLANTADGLYTSRTTDGGATWVGFAPRWLADASGLLPGSVHNCELIGGANGVAWAVTAGTLGTSDPVHFVPVDSTAAACTIVVDSALWDGLRLTTADEIAVYADTLCVGAVMLLGPGPHTLRAWRGDSAHAGYTVGDTMRFRLWHHTRSQERAATALYAVGSGIFGSDTLTRATVSAVFGPPIIEAPDSAAFEPVAVGRSGWLDVPIWNRGDGRLRITGMASTNPVFIPSGLSLAIDGGAMGELSLRFIPADTLPCTTLFTFATNDPTAPFDTVLVTGQGFVLPPTAFGLSAPANDAVIATSTTVLRWRRSYDPEGSLLHYRVWLDTLADLSTAWPHTPGIIDTFCTVAQMHDDQTYFWTVLAMDNNTAGTWARDTFSFHTAIPEAPLSFGLLAPPDGDTLRAVPVTLSWHATTDHDGGAVPRYDVWVDTLAGLATRWQVADSLADTLLALDNLLSDHTYFWTVRATDGNTPGRWASDTLTFVFDTTMDAVAGTVMLPREFRLLQNAPNPFNPQTEIHFELPMAAEVRLRIYNALGQEVTTLAGGRYAPGRYTVAWDGRDAASGIYLYRLEAGAFTEVKKMLLVR